MLSCHFYFWYIFRCCTHNYNTKHNTVNWTVVWYLYHNYIFYIVPENIYLWVIDWILWNKSRLKLSGLLQHNNQGRAYVWYSFCVEITFLHFMIFCWAFSEELHGQEQDWWTDRPAKNTPSTTSCVWYKYVTISIRQKFNVSIFAIRLYIEQVVLYIEVLQYFKIKSNSP